MSPRYSQEYPIFFKKPSICKYIHMYIYARSNIVLLELKVSPIKQGNPRPCWACWPPGLLAICL
uniref:FPPS n=1 Tax=Arundo donax TaxID=35708 RepID=A0A0A9CW11_ARUDO